MVMRIFLAYSMYSDWAPLRSYPVHLFLSLAILALMLPIMAATWFGVEGLIAAGENPESVPIIKAVDFMLL